MAAIMVYILRYSGAAAVGRGVSGAGFGFCVERSTARKVLLLFFGTFFASISKIFILAGAMGTRLSFYGV